MEAGEKRSRWRSMVWGEQLQQQQQLLLLLLLKTVPATLNNHGEGSKRQEGRHGRKGDATIDCNSEPSFWLVRSGDAKIVGSLGRAAVKTAAAATTTPRRRGGEQRGG